MLRSLLVFGMVLVSSAAYAESTFSLPALFGAGSQDSVIRLREAYQSVHQDPAVSLTLRSLERKGAQTLSLSARVKGTTQETTKFQHYYRGVEVFGSMALHHQGAHGVQVSNQLREFDVSVEPTLTAETAVALAQAVAGPLSLTEAPTLKILPSEKDRSATLIYWVNLKSEGLVAGADVLVDAHSGRILANLSKLETLAPVEVASAKDQGLTVLPLGKNDPKTGKPVLLGCKLTDLAKHTSKNVDATTCIKVIKGETHETDNQCQLVLMNDLESGDPVGVNPSACKLVVKAPGVADASADETTLRAASNSKKVLEYYLNTHKRDGFDNEGSEVLSVVHVGLHYGNAAWFSDLNFMMYGDGDGVEMGDMTLGLDVAGHELTHGVTGQTARLAMMNEAGALNEAYADFFGKMIAQDGNWIMGGDLSLDKVGFPGIRDLKDPGSMHRPIADGAGVVADRKYPAHVSEQIKKLDGTECGKANDRCWVHFNSTIPSHAAYLVHEAIGRDRAQTLYYLTLTQYLTPNATFSSSATATLEACATLYDAATCEQVKGAFRRVGLL